MLLRAGILQSVFGLPRTQNPLGRERVESAAQKIRLSAGFVRFEGDRWPRLL
jgi:hypothetical protein